MFTPKFEWSKIFVSDFGGPTFDQFLSGGKMLTPKI